MSKFKAPSHNIDGLIAAVYLHWPINFIVWWAIVENWGLLNREIQGAIKFFAMIPIIGWAVLAMPVMLLTMVLLQSAFSIRSNWGHK